nr:hypothetical protein [Burkholderia gladioli]
MSWYGGSQVAPTLSASSENAAWISSASPTRLRWVIITPLGVPVDPEVY